MPITVWASDANHTNGEQIGNPTKVNPPASNRAEGFVPGTILSTGWLNYVLNEITVLANSNEASIGGGLQSAFNASVAALDDPVIALGSNDLTIDGSTLPDLLALDGSANRVGIGTGAPDKLLHVSSGTLNEGAHLGNGFVGNRHNAAYASFGHFSATGSAVVQKSSGASVLLGSTLQTRIGTNPDGGTWISEIDASGNTEWYVNGGGIGLQLTYTTKNLSVNTGQVGVDFTVYGNSSTMLDTSATTNTLSLTRSTLRMDSAPSYQSMLAFPSSGAAPVFLEVDDGDTSSGWTATVSGVHGNLSDVSVRYGMFQRIGDVVSFSLRVQFDVDTTGVHPGFRVALPIASNFTNTDDVLAQGDESVTLSNFYTCTADTTNDTLSIGFNTSTTGLAMSATFVGHYRIR